MIKREKENSKMFPSLMFVAIMIAFYAVCFLSSNLIVLLYNLQKLNISL